jgi:hypothetical protein
VNPLNLQEEGRIEVETETSLNRKGRGIAEFMNVPRYIIHPDKIEIDKHSFLP